MDMMRTSRSRGRRLAAAATSFVLLASLAAAAQSTAQPKPAAAPAAEPARGPAVHVEARITDLHKKLAITPAQEAAFKVYADIMRANAQAMEEMFRDRALHRDTTAPGVVHWYAELTTAHADGLNRLLPAFDALYGELSDQQKKAADAAFAPLRQGRPPRKAG